MRPFAKMAVPAAGALLLAVAVTSWHQARAETPAPPFIGEEIQRLRGDFAIGGVHRAIAMWSNCIDRVRINQNANAAERCVVYGYGALLLSSASGPGTGVLTAELMAPGQIAMLEVMGIPSGPRQAWLDRYRRWVSETYTPERNFDTGSGFTSDGARTPDRGFMPDTDVTPMRPAARPRSVAPVRADAPDHDDGADGGITPISNVAPIRGFTPSFGPSDGSNGGSQPAPIDLAKMASGQRPAEALQQPEIGDAVRRLVGPAIFGRLKGYGFGEPMESNGRFTIGMACPPRDCGGSKARFVFSTDEVWAGIVEGGRMRIYGNPPRKIRALLLRDKNQAAWDGAIDDMSHPPTARVIPAVAEVAPKPRDVTPPRPTPDSDATEVRLRRKGDTFDVPVTVNDTLTLPFAIDSGASDVSVSPDVLQKLMQSGTVSRGDFLGKQTYHLADGSRVASETFRIHSLKVGDREVHNVVGSVTGDTDSMLLGQSFLSRFRSWSIDNQRGVLSLR